ncbi:MAG: tetratricopeptide repeat protein [Dissulfuribacterales bacterium]
MSSLFEALKNLERRQTQPENPFSNAPEPRHTAGNEIKRFLRQFLSRPFGVLIAALSCAVLMGFVALFAVDWYLKKVPLQHPVTVNQTQPIEQIKTIDTPAPIENLPQTPTPTAPAPSQNPQDETVPSVPKPASVQTDTQSSLSQDIAPTQQKQSDTDSITTKATIEEQKKNREEMIQNDKMKTMPMAQAMAQGQTPTQGPGIQVQVISTPQDDSARWHKNLLEQAETLRKQGKFQEAIPLYTKLWNATHDPAIANNLAGIYLVIEKPQEAVAILNEAVKISPQDEDIKYNLELALNMLKMDQEK